MRLTELMAQDTVTLTAGDYLVANTDAVGYLPTYKDTSKLHRGHYMFHVIEGKKAGSLEIVPLNTSLDGETVVEDKENPIVVIETRKITYMTTRNDPNYRDVYRSPAAHVVKDIKAGEEHRHALAAFIAFADSEYSVGVQHFQLVGPEYMKDPDTAEEDPPITTI